MKNFASAPLLESHAVPRGTILFLPKLDVRVHPGQTLYDALELEPKAHPGQFAVIVGLQEPEP